MRFGTSSEDILYDNMKQVVSKLLLKQEDSTLHRQLENFAGFYGFKTILFRPDHDRRYADNTKITTELGWKPAYTFEKGMKEAIQWLSLSNGDWLAHVTSGAYQEYYQRMYEKK